MFLESAGRDDAVTPNGIEGAVGLTQILAGTATDLLDMQVDTRRSAQLSAPDRPRAVARPRRQGRASCAASGREADERFDGAKSLAATGRYLKLARDTLGREDFAFVSYHMGIGNLQGVLRAFGENSGWPEVYFDSTLRPPRGRLRPAARARRRLLELLLEGARGARDHAPVPRRPHGARAADRAARRQGLRRGGPAPAGLGAAVRRSRPAARRLGRPADRRLPEHAQGHRPGARREHGRAGGPARPARRALPRAAPRGARDGALHRRPGARAQRRVAARGHLDGARRALPAASSSRATARRPGTSRCTRRAGRSTSSAATCRAARRWRSRTCSTGCPCSAGSRGCASPMRSTSRSPRRPSRSSRCSTGYNPVRDRRHPHTRRAARGAAGLPLGAAVPPGRGPPARPRRRGRRRARRVLARRADVELPVAQGRAARDRGRLPRDHARPAGLRPLGQADRRGLVLLRPPRRPRPSGSSRTSTCAARRSSATTGAARSACGSRSSSPTAWTGSC